MNTSKPYGTYERFTYQTVPLPVVDWRGVVQTMWGALQALTVALALVVVIAAAMAMAYLVAGIVVACIVGVAKLAVIGAGCYAAWRLAALIFALCTMDTAHRPAWAPVAV